MKKALKLSIILIFVASNFLIGQTTAEEKLSLMQNSLLLGLEKKGMDIGVEIISLSKFSSVKEKALFTLAQYFFSEGILGNIDEKTRLYKSNFPYINKAYTFYLNLLKEYPHGEFKDIAAQRINYLEQNYKTNLLFRNLYNYNANERLIVLKKLNFAKLFITTKQENPFLFFNSGDDANTYELLNRYLDDIIVNNPSQAIFAYYQKLLADLSRSANISIISGVFENESFSNFKWAKSEDIIKKAIDILNILKNKAPHHPLTIRAYLVTVSYFIKADYWKSDSREVKKWLEIALKNDNDKLGVKYLVTKEYMLKTEF